MIDRDEDTPTGPDAEPTDAANDADAPDASREVDAAADVDALAAEMDTMRDQLIRALAEADNTRKRAARDVEEAHTYAVTKLARDLLSVSDNLARALVAVSTDQRESMGDAGKNLLAGVEMTEKELHAVLSRHGVTPIPADPGAKFDPNVHQAAAQIPSDQPAGAIVDVIQSGWAIGERTLRAAMVAVSAGQPAGSPTTPDPAPEPSSPADDAPGAKPGGVVDTNA